MKICGKGLDDRTCGKPFRWPSFRWLSANVYEDFSLLVCTYELFLFNILLVDSLYANLCFRHRRIEFDAAASVRFRTPRFHILSCGVDFFGLVSLLKFTNSVVFHSRMILLTVLSNRHQFYDLVQSSDTFYSTMSRHQRISLISGKLDYLNEIGSNGIWHMKRKRTEFYCLQFLLGHRLRNS